VGAVLAVVGATASVGSGASVGRSGDGGGGVGGGRVCREPDLVMLNDLLPYFLGGVTGFLFVKLIQKVFKV
jgi:hypothetical protein